MDNVNETNETKPRRPRRSKADIENAINKAAVSQIKKKGFAGALVTDIVRKAKIEPIVFYNRYKNLYEFYDEFVKRYDYWMSGITRSVPYSEKNPNKYAHAIETMLKELMADELMVEVLRWEIAEDNHITNRTARMREVDFHQLLGKFADEFSSDDFDAAALAALIIGGVCFMVLHKDRSTFGGIDINTKDGYNRIAKTIHNLGSFLQQQKEADDSRRKLAEALAKEGLSPEAIERCLNEI